MKSGLTYSKLISFDEGSPDGNISWSLLDVSGTLLTSGTVTAAVNAISATINIDGSFNTLTAGTLRSVRELLWSYQVDGVTINGLERYKIEGSIPFSVSTAGVRNKLGVAAHELEDHEIDLIEAFYNFEDLVTAAVLTPLYGNETKTGQRIANAIEAMAALMVLPSLMLRVAQRETSGTDQFTRFDIDWDALHDALEDIVEAGHVAAVPNFNPTEDYGSIFTVATGPDRFTG